MNAFHDADLNDAYKRAGGRSDPGVAGGLGPMCSVTRHLSVAFEQATLEVASSNGSGLSTLKWLLRRGGATTAFQPKAVTSAFAGSRSPTFLRYQHVQLCYAGSAILQGFALSRDHEHRCGRCQASCFKGQLRIQAGGQFKLLTASSTSDSQLLDSLCKKLPVAILDHHPEQANRIPSAEVPLHVAAVWQPQADVRDLRRSCRLRRQRLRQAVHKARGSGPP
eukprot:scaffold1910_cov251-Pinguiococcus_pyrenoidosus.AAC.1